MAGFSKLYVIGELGGFQGADGVNPIYMQIWGGDAHRQWFQPHYVDTSITPLGNITSVVPKGPNDPNALLDACIVFFPAAFKDCPSLRKVEEALGDITLLDLSRSEKVPTLWSTLRAEAEPFFKRLNIFEAQLHRLLPRENL